MSQIQNIHINPGWWAEEHDAAWDLVKKAVKQDWEQTRHAASVKTPADSQKNESTAKPPPAPTAYEQFEAACRFGHGARVQYGDEYPDWDEELEARLMEDWREVDPARNWNEDREAVRYGWDFADEL